MGNVQFRVKWVAAHEASPRDVQAWAELESRAAEPNAYLSPHHVIPAARHLDREAPPMIFMVERHAPGSTDLVGVGAFTQSKASRTVPMQHLLGYRSRHTPLSGLLLDRACSEDSGRALIDFIRRQTPQHSCIHIPTTWVDGSAAQMAASLLQTRTDEAAAASQLRAVLVPSEAGPQLVEEALGAKRKEIARQMRRLRERGEVAWRCHRGGPIPEASVEALLALEHAGWKGEAGTSLRSQPGDEAFFREMVAGFGAEGRAVFTELTLDGRPIAATSNFISGRTGFAFKIGWDPAFKAYSPGVLNEIEFVMNAATLFPDLSLFDSGATTDSFINRLWPQRKGLSDVTLPTNSLAQMVVRSHSTARSFKRRLDAGQDQFLGWQASKPELVSAATFGIANLIAYL